MRSLMVLVTMWVASVSVSGKTVTILIYPTPEPNLKEFPVEISDDATLYKVIEKAQTDGQMTFKGIDYGGDLGFFVTTIDGIVGEENHYWRILGGDTKEDLTPLTLGVSKYDPYDGEFIKFDLTYNPEQGDYVRILVSGIQYLESFIFDFIAVSNEGDTLLDVMTRAAAYNQMTFKVEDDGNGNTIVVSIDGVANTNALCSPYWQVYGGKSSEINKLPLIQKPVDEYIPFVGEVIQFAMVELYEGGVGECGSDEHQKYNTGARVWYSYMIIITAALSSLYIA